MGMSFIFILLILKYAAQKHRCGGRGQGGAVVWFGPGRYCLVWVRLRRMPQCAWEAWAGVVWSFRPGRCQPAMAGALRCAAQLASRDILFSLIQPSYPDVCV